MEPNELTGTNNNNMEHISGSNNSNFLVSSNNSEVCSNNEIREPRDNELQCGTCKKILPRGSSTDSYCTILRDHYLESFLEKEGEHIKMVKLRAALDIGQMYWCNSCILIFEKPWSLFQHVADKAKGIKVQKCDKKTHLDWLETVAALLAGLDLGLFTAGKIRNDLRNLLADQHSFEEELEEAALTAAAFMQWLNPAAAAMAGYSPGSGNGPQSMAMNPAVFGGGGGLGMNSLSANTQHRFQPRDMVRRWEQFNRQMQRKQYNSMNFGGYNNRYGSNYNNAPYGGNYGHKQQGKYFSDGSYYPTGRQYANTGHSELSANSPSYVPAGLKQAVISAVSGGKNEEAAEKEKKDQENDEKDDDNSKDRTEEENNASEQASEIKMNDAADSAGQKLKEMNLCEAGEA